MGTLRDHHQNFHNDLVAGLHKTLIIIVNADIVAKKWWRLHLVVLKYVWGQKQLLRLPCLDRLMLHNSESFSYEYQ